jgi:hypothetical protein
MYYSSLDAPPTKSSDFSLLSLVFFLYIYANTTPNSIDVDGMNDPFSFYTHPHTLQLMRYYLSISPRCSCRSDRMTTNLPYIFSSTHMVINKPWQTIMRTFIFLVIHADNGTYRWILLVYIYLYSRIMKNRNLVTRDLQSTQGFSFVWTA